VPFPSPEDHSRFPLLTLWDRVIFPDEAGNLPIFSPVDPVEVFSMVLLAESLLFFFLHLFFFSFKCVFYFSYPRHSMRSYLLLEKAIRLERRRRAVSPFLLESPAVLILFLLRLLLFFVSKTPRFKFPDPPQQSRPMPQSPFSTPRKTATKSVAS